MKSLELVRLALSRLGTSRVRAGLTMLGVIIGVASVVALVGVAQGATSGITSRLESLGTNLLTVNPGSLTSGFVRGAAGSATTLTLDDAAAIGQVSGIAGVAPQVQTSQVVAAGDTNTTTTVTGTTAAYAAIRNETIWVGSFLTDAATERGLRVAVLGATTADDLDLGVDDIGTTIRIGGIPFELVGILQSKGSSGIANQDDAVYVPLAAVQHYWLSGDSVRTIAVSVETADGIDAAKSAITSTLRQRHGTTSTTDDFSIQDQAQLLDTFSSVTTLLTVLLAGIASISLLVGGIGIMNIMLVSVRERTREIGIRKAVGARGVDILAQFLVEALTLSLLGGLIGIGLGLAASVVIGAIAGWGFVFSPPVVVVALAFSLAVGVVFGVWPARQAARLDPIVALRYE
jgi:putative ABC transport system permease protein